MDNYSLLLNKIRKDSMEMLNLSSTNPEDIKNQYISVDNIYDLFYHLFDTNSLLERNDSILENDKYNKFVFTEEYPDEVETDSCTVTFEVTHRKCADLKAKTEYMSASHTNYRPMLLCEQQDMENGGSTTYWLQPYDNEITFYCWAKKAKYAKNIASLIENTFLSSYYYIKQRVGAAVFRERGTPIIKTSYGDKRLIGVPVRLFIRTYEISCSKQAILNKLPQLIREDIK